MTILAFMQNQWFRDPGHVRALLESTPDPMRREKLRRRMIHYALFAGCKSGRVLKRVFGNLCDRIVWEEASREIGGRAADAFPADLVHMAAVITGLQPDVIIVFGKTAADALQQLRGVHAHVIRAPHPAARHAMVVAELQLAAGELREILSRAGGPKDPTTPAVGSDSPAHAAPGEERPGRPNQQAAASVFAGAAAMEVS